MPNIDVEALPSMPAIPDAPVKVFDDDPASGEALQEPSHDKLKRKPTMNTEPNNKTKVEKPGDKPTDARLNSFLADVKKKNNVSLLLILCSYW